MNRRVMAGLLAIGGFVVSSVAFAPRMAHALSRPITCDAKLEICADNATNNYYNCVCNVNGNDCPVTAEPYALAPAPSSNSSVAACVVGLQLDLSKCMGEYIACKILPGGGTTNRQQ